MLWPFLVIGIRGGGNRGIRMKDGKSFILILRQRRRAKTEH
jgi:hypothetical protein